MNPFIFAIDPGNIESGWAILNEILKPIEFGKTNNEALLEKIVTRNFKYPGAPHFAIEMVAHYGTGMPAGKTVFDTCVWIGRFWQVTGYIPHRRMDLPQGRENHALRQYEGKGRKHFPGASGQVRRKRNEKAPGLVLRGQQRCLERHCHRRGLSRYVPCAEPRTDVRMWEA